MIAFGCYIPVGGGGGGGGLFNLIAEILDHKPKMPLMIRLL